MKKNKVDIKHAIINSMFILWMVSILLLALLPLHFETHLYQCIAGGIGIVTCTYSLIVFISALIHDFIKERKAKKERVKLTPEQIKEQKKIMIADFRALADTLEKEMEETK